MDTSKTKGITDILFLRLNLVYSNCHELMILGSGGSDGASDHTNKVSHTKTCLNDLRLVRSTLRKNHAKQIA